MVIKKCSTEDLESIFSIITKAGRRYNEIIDGYRDPFLPFREIEKAFQENVEFYGVIIDEEMKAYIGYERIDHTALVRGLFVLPDYQRKGIGSQLLSYVEDKAKREQVRKILLLTLKDAYWAVNFYQKHKFKMVEQRRTNLANQYWPAPPPELQTYFEKQKSVLMEKHLL